MGYVHLDQSLRDTSLSQAEDSSGFHRSLIVLLLSTLLSAFSLLKGRVRFVQSRGDESVSQVEDILSARYS